MTPIQRLYIFDMDGTLIDSKDAVLTAYNLAARDLGVQLPTTDKIWDRTADEWGCSRALHALKKKHYETLCRERVTPGWAWKTFLMAEKSEVWTGASFGTVTMLAHQLPWARLLREAKTGMRVEDKRVAMLRLRMNNPYLRVEYYDDNLTLATRICRDIPLVSIHTIGSVAICE